MTTQPDLTDSRVRRQGGAPSRSTAGRVGVKPGCSTQAQHLQPSREVLQVHPDSILADPEGRTRYSVGIDVGSTTAKVVILDDARQIVFSTYQRHNAETLLTVREALSNAQQKLGDVPITVSIAGSAGMGLSERYDLPFVQEVVASAEVVRLLYPEVRTLIDIGGEDAKLIFFEEGGQPSEMRMNGACAGGTGAFIDQMATLLDVDVARLSGLAGLHMNVYPIASRCGVFAKTDVQNLLAREIPHQDIAASIF
ncbi:MAG: BadF/BadG/BcrA/BcrD ATPase family protein, partial [Acidimicrobiia bacterium]